MDHMFYKASAFNGDIGAWAVDSVKDMDTTFYEAKAFNQDLSGWAVQSVRSMWGMFARAPAFDQDLGWCVDNDVSLKNVFENTQCESTSCGVLHLAALSCGGTPLGDASIRTASDAWLANRTAAEATYGHISTWETGDVTDAPYR